MGRTALVTGGAGFIGSHLCDRLLADAWSVRVLDDLSTGSRRNLAAPVTLIEGDVRATETCLEACAGVDTVFHLAARVTIRRSLETFYDDASANVMGTLAVLQAAGHARVRRFVLASSMGVYADSPDRSPVAETHPTEPLSPYGIGKLAAERYVLLLGPALGVEPVVLRLFNTYGTRQGYTPYVGVVTIFVTRMLRGEPCTIFGDGEQCRDYVHVSDVANAFVLAADAPRAVGEAVNVGTGVGTTVNQLAAALQAQLGHGEIVQGPAHPTELRHSVPDVAKARAVLGYEPRVRFPDRLDEVIADLRTQTA